MYESCILLLLLLLSEMEKFLENPEEIVGNFCKKFVVEKRAISLKLFGVRQQIECNFLC